MWCQLIFIESLKIEKWILKTFDVLMRIRKLIFIVKFAYTEEKCGTSDVWSIKSGEYASVGEEIRTYVEGKLWKAQV